LNVAAMALFLTGSLKIFRLDVSQAKSDKLFDHLNLFLNCKQYSEEYTKLPQVSGHEGEAKQWGLAKCISRQSPYLFVYTMTSLFMLITSIIVIVTIWKKSIRLFILFTLLEGLTLSLSALSMYVMFVSGYPIFQFIPCENMKIPMVMFVEKSKMGACYNTPLQGDRKTAVDVFRYFAYFWVGLVTCALVQLILVGMMVPIFTHLLDEYYQLKQSPPSPSFEPHRSSSSSTTSTAAPSASSSAQSSPLFLSLPATALPSYSLSMDPHQTPTVSLPLTQLSQSHSNPQFFSSTSL